MGNSGNSPSSPSSTSPSDNSTNSTSNDSIAKGVLASVQPRHGERSVTLEFELTAAQYAALQSGDTSDAAPGFSLKLLAYFSAGRGQWDFEWPCDAHVRVESGEDKKSDSKSDSTPTTTNTATPNPSTTPTPTIKSVRLQRKHVVRLATDDRRVIFGADVPCDLKTLVAGPGRQRVTLTLERCACVSCRCRMY